MKSDRGDGDTCRSAGWLNNRRNSSSYNHLCTDGHDRYCRLTMSLSAGAERSLMTRADDRYISFSLKDMIFFVLKRYISEIVIYMMTTSTWLNTVWIRKTTMMSYLQWLYVIDVTNRTISFPWRIQDRPEQRLRRSDRGYRSQRCTKLHLPSREDGFAWYKYVK